MPARPWTLLGTVVVGTVVAMLLGGLVLYPSSSCACSAPRPFDMDATADGTVVVVASHEATHRAGNVTLSYRGENRTWASIAGVDRNSSLADGATVRLRDLPPNTRVVLYLGPPGERHRYAALTVPQSTPTTHTDRVLPPSTGIAAPVT